MTATTPDPGADMLAELAEMDLSVAKHIHAQLLAATDADTVADLSRSYQRVSRCVRQTVALRAKLAQEAVVHRIRTTPTPLDGWMAQARETLQEEAQFERLKVLQNAVSRLIYTEFSDATIRADYIEALDIELDDWMNQSDFTTANLDAQVLRASRALGLREELAHVWRDLPEPQDDDDIDGLDDSSGDDAPTAEPPIADTG